MPQTAKTNYKTGLIAEYIAAIFLWLNGYRILKHRFKTSMGEIDWITQKNKTIIAVEVKFRSRIEDSLSAVSDKSRARILNTLNYFAAHDPCSPKDYETLRVDVIAIAPYKIIHIKNAWGEDT